MLSPSLSPSLSLLVPLAQPGLSPPSGGGHTRRPGQRQEHQAGHGRYTWVPLARAHLLSSTHSGQPSLAVTPAHNQSVVGRVLEGGAHLPGTAVTCSSLERRPPAQGNLWSTFGFLTKQFKWANFQLSPINTGFSLGRYSGHHGKSHIYKWNISPSDTGLFSLFQPVTGHILNTLNRALESLTNLIESYNWL